ncbi:hypothetical protein ACLKA7_006927 [Drosophila subpalustris]
MSLNFSAMQYERSFRARSLKFNGNLREERTFVALCKARRTLLGCLSGQHKYAKYPRDLCCCQKKTEKNKCGWRETLGQKGDPLWEKPQCQTKCEGLQQLLDIDELHRRCKHAKCEPKPKEKLIPRVGDSSMRNRKRLRKRPVTAFDYNRSRNTGTHLEEHAQALAEKNKGNPPPPSKDTASSPSKDTASATASKSNSKQK